MFLTSGADAIDNAAAVLPEGLLQDDEVVLLLLRPNLLYIPLSCLMSLAFIGLATLVFAYIAQPVATWQTWLGWTDGAAFAFGTVVAFGRVAWQTLEWYSRVYVLTDRRVLRRMGVLRVAVFQTELCHVQHTSVFTSLRERLFGLGTIGFSTAGSDVFEAFWEMVHNPFIVHKSVVEALQRYGKHR